MKKRLRTSAGKAAGFLTGKGFYIALFLCVAALGISGYLIFFTGNSNSKVTEDESIKLPQINFETTDNETTFNDSETVDADESLPVFSETNTDSTPTEDTTTSTDSDTEQNSDPEQDSDSSFDSNESTAVETSGFIWPLTGELLHEFSTDALVFNSTTGDWRTHSGIDIAANVGSIVMSAAYGTVEDVYEDELLGTTVVINHGNGLYSKYSNLAEHPTVSVGDAVSCGQVIGAVGVTTLVEINSAPHLHFEMVLNDSPIDPAEYLPSLT